MSSAPTQNPNRWPRQVGYILGNEAAERFSYYGMKAILALYITNVLMRTKDDATAIIHLFGFTNYFMPMVGAWVSDRFLGRYHTILWISLSYCVGHGVMALSDVVGTVDGKILCLYIGLGLIAFGAGGIKPCVSAFMGDQFRADQRHLLQKAYAAFYWSINLGSTASFLIIPWIRKEYGYSWAFGVPGIAMGLATFVFWLGTKHYVRVPPTSKTRTAGFMRVFVHALGNQRLRKPGQGFWDVARGYFTDPEVDAARSLGPILSIFALIPVFWALFDQTFSTWVLQGEKMKPVFVGEARISPGSIKNLDELVPRLQAGTNGALRYVWEQLPVETRQKAGDTNLSVAIRKDAISAGLNTIISQPASLFDPGRFAGIQLGPDTTTLMTNAMGAETILRVNRLLLEDTFPDELAKSYRIGPEEMLSANPILVMIFLPIMTLIVYPMMGRLATPLRRMSYGMFLSAFSFVIVAWLQVRIDEGEKITILWQIIPYIVLTIAEVLVSTTGLEFAFREAAPSMKSTIMGFWNLTVAVGNLFVTVVTALAGKILGTSNDASISPKVFMFYAILTVVVAVLFSIVCAFYKYRDESAAQGK